MVVVVVVVLLLLLPRNVTLGEDAVPRHAALRHAPTVRHRHDKVRWFVGMVLQLFSYLQKKTEDALVPCPGTMPVRPTACALVATTHVLTCLVDFQY